MSVLQLFETGPVVTEQQTVRAAVTVSGKPDCPAMPDTIQAHGEFHLMVILQLMNRSESTQSALTAVHRRDLAIAWTAMLEAACCMNQHMCSKQMAHLPTLMRAEQRT